MIPYATFFKIHHLINKATYVLKVYMRFLTVHINTNTPGFTITASIVCNCKLDGG